VNELGGALAGFAFLIELTELHGREHLTEAPVFALVDY
jgi:adenine/guanine phosphoribosyltransferase-like PRPP-binding protein